MRRVGTSFRCQAKLGRNNPEPVVEEWREVRDFDTYALDWPLDETSIVLEVGGYKGRWARQIAERYNPYLYVFEPQAWAYAQCVERLRAFPRAQVFNYGLGTVSGEFPMGEFGTDGGSFVKDLAQCEANGRQVGTGKMLEVGMIFGALGLMEIDLCLVNIEGYEYELLPCLIEQGLLGRIQRLMLQAHLFVENGMDKYLALRADIERTHRVLWDFGTTLAAWERCLALPNEGTDGIHQS